MDLLSVNEFSYKLCTCIFSLSLLSSLSISAFSFWSFPFSKLLLFSSASPLVFSSLSFTMDFSHSLMDRLYFFCCFWYSKTSCSFSISNSSTRSSTLSMCSLSYCCILMCFLTSASKSWINFSYISGQLGTASVVSIDERHLLSSVFTMGPHSVRISLTSWSVLGPRGLKIPSTGLSRLAEDDGSLWLLPSLFFEPFL